MHAWFSRLPDLSRPDIAVIDLDPSENSDFSDVKRLALFFKKVLDDLGIVSYPKTSGGDGLHICIPITPLPFKDVQMFLFSLCAAAVKEFPDTATTERFIAKRGGRIYLDAVQNAAGKTIAAPYSLRVRPRAPVSAPLHWDELKSRALTPSAFNIKNIRTRIAREGDLTAGMYDKKNDISKYI
jgi:bifunctional non-homologous end joining protein LigD